MERSGVRETAILVIDDEVEPAKIMAEILADSSAQKIFVAHSGAEAIQIVENINADGQYDLDAIVSDIKMPGMSGPELLMELVSKGVYAPVIFVSGFGDLPSVLHALRLSAFDFISKPYNAVILIESVQTAISKGQRIRSILAGLDSLSAANIASSASADEKKAMSEMIENAQKQWRMSYLLGLKNSKSGR